MEHSGQRQQLAPWGWLHSIGMGLHAGERASLAIATVSCKILTALNLIYFFSCKCAVSPLLVRAEYPGRVVKSNSNIG